MIFARSESDDENTDRRARGGLAPPVTSVREPMTAFAELVGERFGGRPAVALEIVAR
ncbi:hypothetical protein L1856_36110 [Streptomyces sp. Tue 6430]|nr:hypothetical protein [Streptomyces sp. Tue 6430]